MTPRRRNDTNRELGKMECEKIVALYDGNPDLSIMILGKRFERSTAQISKVLRGQVFRDIWSQRKCYPPAK